MAVGKRLGWDKGLVRVHGLGFRVFLGPTHRLGFRIEGRVQYTISTYLGVRRI